MSTKERELLKIIDREHKRLAALVDQKHKTAIDAASAKLTAAKTVAGNAFAKAVEVAAERFGVIVAEKIEIKFGVAGDVRTRGFYMVVDKHEKLAGPYKTLCDAKRARDDEQRALACRVGKIRDFVVLNGKTDAAVALVQGLIDTK